MRENFHDSMAMVRKFGKPTLFITMTANANWPEIHNALLEHQSPNDRPDLICRVFHLKLKELLKEIKEKKIFGRMVSFVQVVEFQKRGLPHAHILVWLHPSDVPNTRQEVESIIQAEIPDPVKFPVLNLAVKRFMIHGPCLNTANSPCCINGICSRKYPKEYSERTHLDLNEQVVYKRCANTGHEYFDRSGRHVTNQWVVPFNGYLLLRFQCHINVELVHSLDSIKYLFKYF
jgi:hypothetical protein